MRRVTQGMIRRIRSATSERDLYEMVQSAIELEHATIPPYLCAYFTLKLGTNQTVGGIIRSVVVEEMLHMSIAANLLLAIGGSPQINKRGFVPSYPTQLPYDIGDITVPLAKCSIGLVKDVFMAIEAPETPIPIRLPAPSNGAPNDEEYATIGAFYTALRDKLVELGTSAFEHGRPDLEMVDNTWFPPSELFRISGPVSAAAAIDLIIRQGEGREGTVDPVTGLERPTSNRPPPSPLDPEGAPAHYYRFQEIVKGRRLVRDPDAPSGFSYTGPPVVFDASSVWNMQPNPDPDGLPDGSRSKRVAIQFAYAYTRALNALHETFNGNPQRIGAAMGLMYELRLQAQEVLSTPLPGQPEVQTGLCFRYQPTTS